MPNARRKKTRSEYRFGGVERGGFREDHLSSNEIYTIGHEKVTMPTIAVFGIEYPSPSRATMAL
jgi:hypothetical protein